jgi:anti-sigma regulatory factor (Ser/Thr protein kinase)
MDASRQPVERSFSRRVEALDDIFRFVSDFAAELGLGEDRALAVQFVVEEIFTNMVKYDRDGKRDIAVQLQLRGERVVVALTDYDVEPFDVTQVPEPDFGRPFAETSPGGLGLHLVRKLSESIAYEHNDGNSTVVVTMKA